MSIIRWNPSLPSLLSRWPETWNDESFLPMTSPSSNLDVYETENEVVIKANVAGVPEDKIDLTFEKGVLWIKADVTEEEEDKKKMHYSKSSWRYSYKVAVPGIIDMSMEPTATVKDGVITVIFKKAEESKPKKLTVKKA